MSKLPQGVPAKKLKATFSSIRSNKKKASEFNGLAGKTQQQFMKEHQLDRTAFNLVLKLKDLEPSAQQTTLRGVIEYAHKMEMFDEVDAFDDMATRMAEISSEIMARRHNGSAPDPDPVIDEITGDEG